MVIKNKYKIDVRVHNGQYDKVILQTNDFREALSKFDELKATLEEFNHACEFDIVAWYVWSDTYQGEYVPVVMASIETNVKEW